MRSFPLNKKAGCRKEVHTKKCLPLQQHREAALASVLEQKPAWCGYCKQFTVRSHESFSQWNCYISFCNPGNELFTSCFKALVFTNTVCCCSPRTSWENCHNTRNTGTFVIFSSGENKNVMPFLSSEFLNSFEAVTLGPHLPLNTQCRQERL